MQSFGPWLHGSTVPFPARLELTPRRSWLALMLWLAAAIGVAAGLSSLELPWWLLVPLLMLLFLGGRDLVWPRFGRETLSWDGRSWRLIRGGHETAVVDCRWEFVSRWLVVLSFRQRRRRYWPVFADSVPATDFRNLLVLARDASAG